MKLLIVGLLCFSQSYASVKLANDWVDPAANADTTSEIADAFNTVLDAQGEALDRMVETKSGNKSSKGLFGYEMKEMFTDFSVTQSGLFGLSAMTAQEGVEVKWMKLSSRPNPATETPPDFVVEESVTQKDLDGLSDSIVNVVNSTGKVKSHNLKEKVSEALSQVYAQVKDINVSSHERWKLRCLRLDLNVSANGAVWFITRAGVAVRVRMEWKLKDVPLTVAKIASANENTKFVAKVLEELNEALTKVNIAGLEPQKVYIGVGTQQARNFIGLWKYSAGLIGWLGFIPVKLGPLNKSVGLHLAKMPLEMKNEDFSFGGEEDEPVQKMMWPFHRKKISQASFQMGLTKSLQTAAFFAAHADKKRSTHWALTDIRTVNQITHTGFFGLANTNVQGNLEIDFKRILP